MFSLSFLQFQDFRFLCPNDTVFDQQNLVCTNWFEVDCYETVQLFLTDYGHKKEGDTSEQNRIQPNKNVDYEYFYEYEDGSRTSVQKNNEGNQNQGNRFLANSSPAFADNLGNPNVGRGQQFDQLGDGFRGSNKFNQDNDISSNAIRQGSKHRRPSSTPQKAIGPVTPILASTPRPLAGPGGLNTRRPPRVKSDIRLRQHGAGGKRKKKPINKHGGRFSFNSQGKRINPGFRQPEVRPDGRTPRVKSNLKHKSRKKNKFKEANRSKAGNRINPPNNVKFVSPNAGVNSFSSEFGPHDNNAATGPEVRPDGRAPRVKSNILATKSKQFNRKKPQPTQSPFHLIPSARPQASITTQRPQFVSTTQPPKQFVSTTQRPHQFVSSTQRPHQFVSTTRRPFVSSTQKPQFVSTTPRPTHFVSRTRRPQSSFAQNTFPPTTARPNFVSSTLPPQSFFANTPSPPSFFVTNNVEPVVTSTAAPVTLQPFSESEPETVNELFPTVSPTRFRNRPTTASRRPSQRPSFSNFRNKGPRVKSDIRLRQQNRFRNKNRFRGRGRRPVVTTAAPVFASTTAAPFTQQSNRFAQNRPEFVDEIDEIEQPRTSIHSTPAPFVFSTSAPDVFNQQSNRFSSSRPEFVDEIDEVEQPGRLQVNNAGHFGRLGPRVKSDIRLRQKNNRFKKVKKLRKKQRVKTNDQQINFVAPASATNDCSNPFKCPPTKTAPGRRPRVKSNIKARQRNYYNARFGARTNFASRNRIQNQEKDARDELNELLAQITPRRRGKAVNKQKVSNEVTSEQQQGKNLLHSIPRDNPQSTVSSDLSEQSDDYYYADDFKAGNQPTNTPFQHSTTDRPPVTSTTQTPRAQSFTEKFANFPQTTAGPRFPTSPPRHGVSGKFTHRVATTVAPNAFSSPTVSSRFASRPQKNLAWLTSFKSQQNSADIFKVTKDLEPQSTTVSPVAFSSPSPNAIPNNSGPKSFSTVSEPPATTSRPQYFVTTTRGPDGHLVFNLRNLPTVEQLIDHAKGKSTIKNFPPPRDLEAEKRKKERVNQRNQFPIGVVQNNQEQQQQQQFSHSIPIGTPSPKQQQSILVANSFKSQKSVGTASSALLNEIPVERGQHQFSPTPLPNKSSFLSTVKPHSSVGQSTFQQEVPPISNFPSTTKPHSIRVKSNLQQQQKNRWHRNRQAKKIGNVNNNVDRSKINFVSATTVAKPVIDNNFAPTIAPASAISNRFNFAANSDGTATPDPLDEQDEINSVTDINEIGNDQSEFVFESSTLPSVIPDGRAPRVKSNIKARLANKPKSHGHHRASHLVKKGFHDRNTPYSSRAGAGKSIDFDDESKEGNLPATNDGPIINTDDDEPVVRPDGQKPRVKSNLLAQQRGHGGGSKNNHGFRHSKRVKNLQDTNTVFVQQSNQQTSGQQFDDQNLGNEHVSHQTPATKKHGFRHSKRVKNPNAANTVFVNNNNNNEDVSTEVLSSTEIPYSAHSSTETVAVNLPTRRRGGFFQNRRRQRQLRQRKNRPVLTTEANLNIEEQSNLNSVTDESKTVSTQESNVVESKNEVNPQTTLVNTNPIKKQRTRKLWQRRIRGRKTADAFKTISKKNVENPEVQEKQHESEVKDDSNAVSNNDLDKDNNEVEATTKAQTSQRSSFLQKQRNRWKQKREKSKLKVQKIRQQQANEETTKAPRAQRRKFVARRKFKKRTFLATTAAPVTTIAANLKQDNNAIESVTGASKETFQPTPAPVKEKVEPVTVKQNEGNDRTHPIFGNSPVLNTRALGTSTEATRVANEADELESAKASENNVDDAVNDHLPESIV